MRWGWKGLEGISNYFFTHIWIYAKDILGEMPLKDIGVRERGQAGKPSDDDANLTPCKEIGKEGGAGRKRLQLKCSSENIPANREPQLATRSVGQKHQLWDSCHIQGRAGSSLWRAWLQHVPPESPGGHCRRRLWANSAHSRFSLEGIPLATTAL